VAAMVGDLAAETAMGMELTEERWAIRVWGRQVGGWLRITDVKRLCLFS
jgi:hypothetical protein